MEAVAVLGTGIMGAGMAQILIKNGFAVRVWNRSSARAAPLAAAGFMSEGRPGRRLFRAA
ncbi:NAD(P)-binding domain-containing protein [Arthrobacter sp. OAP107]|uniref:NAD(P)-binding domain-containing protein n=1 Tax=Arthrobacter sp. OAP107 TaxID=3156445 RepID=UPI003399290E